MKTQQLPASIRARNPAGAGAIFACFAILYASLRSGDIFATDGAHRCLEVFHRQAIFFHENNHLLYPVNVLAWTRLAAQFGMRANTPFEFYRITELMNCVAAAASLVIVFLLIRWTISSWKIALGAVVTLGLSKAFFSQATNANEAVVGLFWSLLAVLVLVLGLRARSLWLIFVSGLLFPLSMASYESMIFLAPAGLVLIWRTWAEEDRGSPASRPLLVLEGIFLFGCLAAWLGIHGWADWMTGHTSPSEMAHQLFLVRDARSYLGVGPGKALNLPAGLIRNIFPVLAQFDGLRHALSGPKDSLLAFLLAAAVFLIFLIFCGLRVWKHRKELSGAMKLGLWTGITGLLCTLVPLVIWDPQYEKLWLQPLALLAFLIAIALKIPAEEKWQSILVCRVAPCLILLGVLFNFSLLISGHNADVSAYFREAQDVSEKVSAQDLVVGDWDKVAMLYGDAWAPVDRIFDFVMEGVYYGRGATDRLRESVTETERRGGHVYFLGLLDQSETEWKAFIGPRCGIPMSDLDPYREHSHVIATYRDGSTTISLRRLDLSLTQ
ncbi:MAG: hypothetical protein LAO08_01815 [Acidobacteriia bacterium]|nr:hypothetical protein [Terriglobia bacterium]